MTPNPAPTPIPAAAPALRPLDEFWLEEEAWVDADVVDELLLEVEEIVSVGAEGYVGVPVTGSDATNSRLEGAGARKISSVAFVQFGVIVPVIKLQQCQRPVLLS
jgi:hypothetical protein